MSSNTAPGGSRQDDLVTPKRRSRPREQEDFNVQTNDKSLDEHDLNLDDEGGTYVGEVYIPPIAPVCFADPTGPRLIITKIVAFNFKSYAGYVTLGPFTTRFNAIIGPNGSGKSNVIDSMLFVFGYRASKIRANKLSVLMHKSDSLGGVSRCSVAIHFAQIIDKPNEEYELIPGTELEIARTAFYDNSSFYTLNGKKVHFKEVAKVLRNHGVDLLNNRFLILQGEVEQISMMPPKGKTDKETGLLEYLEEIIGTNRYKEPIAQMEALYSKYDEERTEKLTRVQLVETDLKSLEPGLREAVNFLELENCVHRKTNEIYQFEKYENQKALEEHTVKIQQMETELTTDLENIKKYTDEMEAARNELKTVEKELGDKDRQVATTDTFVEKAKIVRQKLNAEQKETEKRNSKAKDELKKEETKLKNLEKVPEKNRVDIEKLENEKEELSEKKIEREERLQQVMTSIASETASLQDEKNELQRVQIDLRKAFDEAKSKCDIAKSELEIYLSTEKKETKKLEDLVTNLEKVQSTLTERKTSLEELTTRIPDMETEVADAKTQLAEVTQQEAILTEEVRKLSREISEARDAMQSNRSANRLIDFVMQLKNENKVTGILGRLGDLGGIDQKYDIAVSTACGALNHIVTETVEAGEAVIAEVKRMNIGRVNVIPLDKMQQYKSACYDKYRTPENVPRLIDLIQVQDERIRLAFYYGARETLVAQDLNQAHRIGYSGGGYRVITLDGALIETSGIMSGGGNQPIRGLMGAKASVSTDSGATKTLQANESKIATMETELRILSQRRMELETQVNCRSNELKYKKQDYDTYQIDVKSLSEQAPELTKLIATQRDTLSKVNIDAKKRAAFEGNVKTLTEQMDKTRAKVDEMETKVAAVHEKIMEISSGKTGELNAELTDISSRLDKTKTQINKLHAGINANDRDVKKSTDKINNLREEISGTETKLENLASKLEELGVDISTNESRAGELRVELKEIQKQYATLKKTFDTNNEELEKVQGKIKNATKDLEEAKKEMEAVQSIVNKLEKRLSNFSLHELLEITLVDGFIEVKTSRPETLRVFTPEELATRNEEVLKKELESIRAQFPEQVPNLSVVQDYKQKYELYMKRVTELQATTQERNKYRKGILDTQKRRTHEFTAAFQLISDKVKEVYQLLTSYGSADMGLDDNLNPFSQGINYCVRPPMKSWKYISNLSGGEKTIASLALVFALHYYKPSPLYFLDEIDAALDVRNVAIIGHYIKERTVNAQFIIISLRPECFDLADRIIGIYKVYNKSNSNWIDPKVLDVLNPHYKPYKRPELPSVKVTKENKGNEASGDKIISQEAGKDKEVGKSQEMNDIGQTTPPDDLEAVTTEACSADNKESDENTGTNDNAQAGHKDNAKAGDKDAGEKDNVRNEDSTLTELSKQNETISNEETELESTFEDIPGRRKVVNRKRKSSEDTDNGAHRDNDDEGPEPKKKCKEADEECKKQSGKESQNSEKDNGGTRSVRSDSGKNSREIQRRQRRNEKEVVEEDMESEDSGKSSREIQRRQRRNEKEVVEEDMESEDSGKSTREIQRRQRRNEKEVVEEDMESEDSGKSTREIQRRQRRNEKEVVEEDMESEDSGKSTREIQRRQRRNEKEVVEEDMESEDSGKSTREIQRRQRRNEKEVVEEDMESEDSGKSSREIQRRQKRNAKEIVEEDIESEDDFVERRNVRRPVAIESDSD